MFRTLTCSVALGLAGLTSACALTNPYEDAQTQDLYKAIEVLESAHSVDGTLDRVTAIVEASGARVFARINHAAGAESIGADMDDTQLLIFGNPAMGTPLISENRLAGLELPVRVLAWSEDGQTWLAYTTPDEIARRADLDPDSEAIRRMTTALSNITALATSEDPLPASEDE